MKVPKVDIIDFNTLQRILESNQITEVQKVDFIKENRVKIAQVVEAKISSTDYKTLMQQRGLQKFRPLKNSFTKKGDKILLAKALNINPSEISGYVKKICEDLKEVNDLDFLSHEKIELIKTYVYRHGSKDDIVLFLDLELQKSKDKLKTLYKTLQYYSGGVADYFIRPIHRMDNKTLVKVYNVLYKNIKDAQEAGDFTEMDAKKHALWALVRIYEIQNNSKLINAIKTYRILK